MPNAVKYTLTAPTGAIQKGTVSIGVDGGTGPTGTTGWYNGIPPTNGKYIIYQTNGSFAPRIFAPQNSDELKRVALQLGATSGDVTSEGAILSWFATQNSYTILNKSYPNIITDSLVYLIDSTFTPSYPTTGTTTYPIRDTRFVGNGTLQNGVGFNTDTGAFIFDGSDDQIPLASSDNFNDVNWSTGFTLAVIYKIDATTDFNSQFRCMIGVTGGGRTWNYYLYGPSTPATSLYYHFSGMGNGGFSNLTTITTDSYHLGVFTVRPGDGYGTYYHDGVAIGTQTMPSTPYYDLAGGTQYLGRGDNMWKGNLAKWMIYNKALTPAEVQQTYYQGNIVSSSLSLAIDGGNILDAVVGTTILDISGNGNTFNFEGTVTRLLNNGDSLRLNNGRIFRDSLGWYGNYTISFWVKMVTPLNSYFYTENYRGSGGCARIYSTMNGNGTFSYNVWDNSSIGPFGTGAFNATTTTNVQDGNWHQITCIWSNGSSNRTRGIYVYCDGVQEAYTDMIGNDGSYASMHLGGAYGCLGDITSDCYLGPILQYNGVALTDAQVKQNYSAHAGRFR